METSYAVNNGNYVTEILEYTICIRERENEIVSEMEKNERAVPRGDEIKFFSLFLIFFCIVSCGSAIRVFYFIFLGIIPVKSIKMINSIFFSTLEVTIFCIF